MSMPEIMNVYGDLISRLKDPDVSDFVVIRKNAFFYQKSGTYF